MAIYMPPLVRKKKVSGHFHPDSFRVISQAAEENHPKYDCSLFHGVGKRPWSGSNTLPNIPGRETRVLPRNMPDYRANKPQPNSCKFLCHDVRLLNEPICSVTTKKTLSEQPFWWHAEREAEYFEFPSYTKDTSYRKDYQYRKDRWPPASTRHGSNPNKDWAFGIVPVNQLGGRKHKHRLFTEKMSHEHQYNSRQDPNYPIRSRRQGHFVWNEVKGEKLQDFIDFHQSLNEMQDNEGTESKRLNKPTTNSVHFNEVPESLPPVMRESEVSQQKSEPARENNMDQSQSTLNYTNMASEYPNTMSDIPNNVAEHPDMASDIPNQPSDNSNNNASIYYQPTEDIEWKLPRSISE